MIDRRTFLTNALATSTLATTTLATESRGWGKEPSLGAEERPPRGLEERLDQIMRSKVVRTEKIARPVKIESIELLQSGRDHYLRTRSSDGLEAITVPHQAKIGDMQWILNKRVIPPLIGQDGREIEELIWKIYRHASNYKMQGLSLWICVAAVEMGILELLCQAAQVPLAALFGERLRDDVVIYTASGNRGNQPEVEIDVLRKLVAESGAKALKFRLGGRMNRDADSLPGRTEALIPMVRKTFGDQMTLYADSNSSYSPKEAIRIGRIMEEHGYGFYEEPCEFDDLWGTKAVADHLTIPVAGGEQEYSLHRWKWMILNRGVDIVQPDLHYGGGFIRAVQVARMADAAGMLVVPHMSGGGLGYLEVIQFASFVKNVGPFMEFKGNTDLPIACDSSTLKATEGKVRCPTGVGFGVRVDASTIRQAKVVANGGN
jgi:L-alanine-DL-glutamate epimerase-like enolase superfamily enzyme